MKPIYGQNRRFTKLELDRFIRRIEAGIPLAIIAKSVGCSPGKLIKAVKREKEKKNDISEEARSGN